jgi:hypothetical protein
MTRSHWLAICGVLLIAAGCAAYFKGMAWWGTRVPDGWTWQVSYVGLNVYADAEGGYPKTYDSVEARRTMSVVGRDEASGLVQIQDHYELLDIVTKEVAWASKLKEWLDPETGLEKSTNGAKLLGLFPRFTQQQDYALGFGYLDGAVMSFVREEIIGGLPTYLFRYVGPMEYTEIYAGTEDYPGIAMEAGQEVRCSDDKYTFNAWVEPVTGEILRFEESCFSGDAIYEIATGRLVQNIARWGGETPEGSVHELAQKTGWERLKLLFLIRYLWIGLVVLGLATIAIGLLGRRQGRQSVPALVPTITEG